MSLFTKNIEGWERSASVPAWPRWTGAPGRITISGWHLTPARLRASWLLGHWSTVGFVLFPLWRCWQFQHIPQALWHGLSVLGVKLGRQSTTVTDRKWAIAGLWLADWLLWSAWEWMFTRFYQRLLQKRTTVSFTEDSICLGGGRASYDRTAAPVTFLLLPHPNLAWAEARARRRGSESLVILHRQTRWLYLQYGRALFLVERFSSPSDAEQFSTVCQAANERALVPIAPETQF